MIELAKRSIKRPVPRSAILALLTAVPLYGCGGGGGGGDGTSGSVAPAASPVAVQTTEDSPVSGTLKASDPDGDPLVFSIVTQSALGAALITNTETGSFTFSPNPEVSGTDTFTFKANDGTSDSNIATVTVTILATNDAPVAVAMNLAGTEDTPLPGTLVATDTELQSLIYSIVSNGALGTATITDAGTGAFVYTPDPDANGSDTFTFKASDGLADSNVATVTIDITPVNDPPLAAGSCNTTPQAQTLARTLSADDPETPAFLTYSLNADGSGRAGPITTAKGGIVNIDQTTGDFTYKPSTAAGNRRGTDSFDFQVSDPDNAVSSATETIVVDQTIMPLGDSITSGRTGPDTLAPDFGPPDPLRVGFRQPLQIRLTESGYSFDFVGSETHGIDVVPSYDYNHEGHGGWSALEIWMGRNGGYPTDGVRAWLDSNPADIVLLHIGTNGLDRNNDIDVDEILDEIDRWEADLNGNPVTVILGLIVDQDPINPEVTAFNNNLRALANDRIAADDEIIIVDHQTKLSYPGDLGDDVHPNASGYSKMAEVWFNALTATMDKCP